MNNGSEVYAYQSSSVPYGSTCAQESRVCTNGTLSGSFTNASCTVASASSGGSNISASNLFGLSAEIPPAGSASAYTAPLTNSDWYDFTVEKVCVDANDQPIAGDPYDCPHSRNLRFGEAIPYMHYSRLWDLDGAAYYSVPAQNTDASPMVLTFTDAGPGWSHDNPQAYRDFDLTDYTSNENWNTVDFNGDLISYTGTGNGGSFYGPIWNQACGHNGEWIEFKKGLADGQTDSMWSPPGAYWEPTCPTDPSKFSSAFDVWTRGNIAYAAGKIMDSIVTYQFAAGQQPNSPNGYVEVDYWTREYGLTRWEAWSTTGPAHGPSNKDCGGTGETDFYGVHYYRGSCVDASHVKTFDVPYQPFVYSGGRDLILSKNLLAAGDFAQGNLGNWKRVDGSGGLVTDWSSAKDPATSGSYLYVACWKGCGNNAVYQDVDTSGFHGNLTLRYGALLKAAAPADATIQMFFYSAGNVVASPKISAHIAGDTWQHVDSTFTWNFDADPPISAIRYAIFPTTGGTLYSLDEAYLTPSI